MMAPIEELPAEILHLILVHTSLKTQKQLLFTSRRFYNLVIPYVYRKATFTLHPSDKNNSKAKILLFIRSLADNPTLADFVKDFSVQGSKPLTIPLNYPGEPPVSNPWITSSNLFPTGMFDRWRNQLLKGDTNAIIALLIVNLKNLETLQLGYDIWSDSQYLAAVLPHMTRLQEACFPEQTRDLMYRGAPDIFRTFDGPISYDMNQLRNLLRLPRIKSITCSAAECNRDGTFVALRRPCTSLSRLSLTRCELTQATLARVLRATPRLRELEYDSMINMYSGGAISQYFDCEQMDTALEPVRDTLEYLRIDVLFWTQHPSLFDIESGYDWGVKGTLTSLSAFPRLTKIKIPFVLLMGWEPQEGSTRQQLAAVLPRSLRDIEFLRSSLDGFEKDKWDRPAECSRMIEYIEGRHTHAPELRIIRVPYIKFRLNSAEDEVAKLDKACREADIKLDLVFQRRRGAPVP